MMASDVGQTNHIKSSRDGSEKDRYDVNLEENRQIPENIFSLSILRIFTTRTWITQKVRKIENQKLAL